MTLFRRWFIQYNPLYFASALLVLAGVFLASAGLSDNLRSHALLAGAAQLYEFALLGAAWLLLRWTRQKRPAVILGIVAFIFLFDAALFSERLASLGRGALWLSAALALLALAKLKLLERIFRLRAITPTFAIAALVLAALPLLPQAIEAAAGCDTLREPLGLLFTWLGAPLLAWSLLRQPTRAWSELVSDDWSALVMARLDTALPLLITGLYAAHAVAWSVYLAVPLTAAHAAPWILAAGAALATRLVRAACPALAELVAWAAAGGAGVASLCTRVDTHVPPVAIIALLAAATLGALFRAGGLRLLLPALLCAFVGGVLTTTGTPTEAWVLGFALALLGAAIWQRQAECLVASAAAIALSVSAAGAPIAALAFASWFTPWAWILFPRFRPWLPLVVGALEIVGAANLSPELMPWYTALAAIPLLVGALVRRRDLLVAGLGGALLLGAHCRDAWTPRTVAGWGAILVVAGFVALVAGFTLNLSAARRAEIHS
jgi:hypothetical protein